MSNWFRPAFSSFLADVAGGKKRRTQINLAAKSSILGSATTRLFSLL
jgi:hypothetical protein